jgi:hypothetical protein
VINIHIHILCLLHHIALRTLISLVVLHLLSGGSWSQSSYFGSKWVVCLAMSYVGFVIVPVDEEGCTSGGRL